MRWSSPTPAEPFIGGHGGGRIALQEEDVRTHMGSRSPANLAALRTALNERAADVAIALLGKANGLLSSRHQLRFGHKGSLAVEIGGPKVGLWYDHEKGVGGDLLCLIERLRGDGFREAISYGQDLSNGEPPHPARSPHPLATPTSSGQDNNTRTMVLWNEAASISETPAAVHLDRRRVLEPALAAGASVLRFHPACPFAGSTRLPCMLALLCDIRTDEPRAIHRTALTPAGHKIGRMMLGPKSGAAIKLCPDAAVATGLVIAEGIETALSGIQLGWRPAWSVVDAVGIAKFPVLPGIEALIILVDNDESGTGQRSAMECSDRWTKAKREVLRVIPRRSGTDFNDVVRKRGIA
jgi:hypothetical protein